MSNSIGWAPIRKVAAAIAAAILLPAVLAALNAVNITDMDWKAVLTAGGSAALTALIAYLTPFAGNERYSRYE